MAYRALIVDDEESIRFTFSEFLSDADFLVDTATNSKEACTFVATESYDVIFLDILLGADNGMDILRFSRELNPHCPVIMVTGSPDVSTAVEAVRLSAYDYLVKPVRQHELLKHAERAVAFKSALDEQERLRRRMRAVFQGVSEGVVIFDADMKVVDLNHAALTMLQLERSVLGMSLKSLAEGSNVLEKLRELIEVRVEGELFRLKFTRDSGAEMSLSVNLSPLISSAGKGYDLVMVLRDESLPVRQIQV